MDVQSYLLTLSNILKDKVSKLLELRFFVFRLALIHHILIMTKDTI